MSQAYFATRNNTKVTAQKGGTALLPCTVLTQTSALVSWVRRRDFQLLTVGLSTYSSDERFLVHHIRHMGHWALRIKAVRDEDQGLYECQLSVHPVQSVFVELKVVDAVADIVGAPDLHIDEGSTLRLECKLKRATEYPDYVFWYHQESMVNFDQQNGFSVTPFQPKPRASSSTPSSTSSTPIATTGSNNDSGELLATDLTAGFSAAEEQLHQWALNQSGFLPYSHILSPATSVLTIKEVHSKHAGNYTCAPSNTRPASITVHVLQ
ncbi:AAEL000103-PA, partial [Aedes aegypti]